MDWKICNFRSSDQKKVWFDWNQSIFTVSFLKWKYSTFLFNSLRFKIILHLLSFLGHTEIGDMYSLFEWCAFLITLFFSNSDTSESNTYIKCICSVEDLCLCVIFSCVSSSAKSMSTIFRISSSIVIYVYSFNHLQDFFIYVICSQFLAVGDFSPWTFLPLSGSKVFLAPRGCCSSPADCTAGGGRGVCPKKKRAVLSTFVQSGSSWFCFIGIITIKFVSDWDVFIATHLLNIAITSPFDASISLDASVRY